MKTQAKIKLLKKLEKYVRDSIKLCDDLIKIGFGCDGRTILALDSLLTQAVCIASVAVEDKGKWVDWMVWENDMGKKEMNVKSVAGKKFKVKTWEQLVEVMEEK